MTTRPACSWILLAIPCWIGLFSVVGQNESGTSRQELASAEQATHHWAFKPPLRPHPPTVRAAAWIRNPIDAFIAIEHESRSITPSPEADRRVLIRRLSLDLLGLPPTPEEVASFVDDNSTGAYEKLVNRLLDSPHYGERWGRHWLDLARWAESDGYEANEVRSHAWRYRDYVVRSFNADKPYDRFLREQIAGDELEPYSDENLIATGFLAGTRVNNNEEDKAIQLNEPLVDIANTVAAVTLGLTLGCAQCHDHKFEPLSAGDYYAFHGFFVRGQVNSLLLKDEVLWKSWEEQRPPELETAKKLRNQLYEPARARLTKEAREKLSLESLKALDTLATERTDEQNGLAKKAEQELQIPAEKVKHALSEEDQKLLAELDKKIARLEKELNEKKPQTWGFYSPATSPHKIENLPPRGMYPFPYKPQVLKTNQPVVLIRGDIHRVGEPVNPTVPVVLRKATSVTTVGAGEGSVNHPTETRRQLVDWLTGDASPLTARVWVNYIWQQHFGRGIVATSADFGTHGAKPTHAELLDWLAVELRENGWSTKHIHQLILTSSTFRQASHPSAANERIDPDNKYLWRWIPRRLESEAIRDAMLAVSGELNPSIGGPGDPSETNSTRRSLYLRQHRFHLPATLALFDAPTGNESCSMRHISTVPLQSLHLLNNERMLKRAESLAVRVRMKAGGDSDRQINTAFEFALGRRPLESELASARKFFESCAVTVAAEGKRFIAANADVPQAATVVAKSEEPLVHFCHALLNLNEFIYVE